ncbi:MAG: 30S ribosomal protein S6 [Clostridiales bacterium]|jgi:small subunit ribosomal protein S6|nr:30S ribosomal protein S6 [Clostridiales bacterium]
MNKYEMALVLKPIEEAAAKEEFEKISGIITRFEGSIDKVDEWGKRRLAYEIDKLNEGVYYFVTFLAEPSAPKEIESRVRIRENVLRYLIIRVDE